MQCRGRWGGAGRMGNCGLPCTAAEPAPRPARHPGSPQAHLAAARRLGQRAPGLRHGVQLRPVAPAKLPPALWVVAKPLAQLGAGGHILEPLLGKGGKEGKVTSRERVRGEAGAATAAALLQGAGAGAGGAQLAQAASLHGPQQRRASMRRASFFRPGATFGPPARGGRPQDSRLGRGGGVGALRLQLQAAHVVLSALGVSEQGFAPASGRRQRRCARPASRRLPPAAFGEGCRCWAVSTGLRAAKAICLVFPALP